MVQWETVERCNFCGSTDTEPYLDSSAPSWYGTNLVIVKCTNCELYRANPRPTPDSIYEDYIAGNDRVKAIMQRKLDRPNVNAVHNKTVVNAIEMHGGKPETLYDMGCGSGTIMMEAQKIGLVAEGNDINRASTDMLNERGIKAYHGYTKDVHPDKQFDIVMNLDYIEHSYEPFDDLKKCFEIMKPGGILYLKTLYLECPPHLLEGDHWKLFGAGHVHYFFPRTMKTMIEKAGFTVFDIQLSFNILRIVARKPASSASQP